MVTLTRASYCIEGSKEDLKNIAKYAPKSYVYVRILVESTNAKEYSRNGVRAVYLIHLSEVLRRG